ncbi:hypothetical protein NEIMUCOT_04566 [Neisseria mucosa ATCC 25996]|uniref:Uncharacterized protein n=1 Tax=Neisseria mucosa (strain ATCC 25996 / DSM 4631 / NCTC 10774 / M26) TaxID=546266 RepID=D2ZVC3_NEIM2|nr:hypothetical protein NEIMUCOT_04566 [Neisseria mucosa ATCC 25996]
MDPFIVIIPRSIKRSSENHVSGFQTTFVFQNGINRRMRRSSRLHCDRRVFLRC